MTVNFVQDHNSVIVEPRIRSLIIDGPRGVGKTSVTNELIAQHPYFYMPIKFREFIDVREVNHIDASIIRMDYLVRFMEQVPFNSFWTIPIFDRFHLTEVVMRFMDNTLTQDHSAKLIEIDKRLSRVAAQVILTCDTSIRLSRVPDRPSEASDNRRLRYTWSWAAETSSVATLTIDTTELDVPRVADRVHSWFQALLGDPLDSPDLLTKQGVMDL